MSNVHCHHHYHFTINICSNYHDFWCCSCSCLTMSANKQEENVRNSSNVCISQPTATSTFPDHEPVPKLSFIRVETESQIYTIPLKDITINRDEYYQRSDSTINHK